MRHIHTHTHTRHIRARARARTYLKRRRGVAARTARRTRPARDAGTETRATAATRFYLLFRRPRRNDTASDLTKERSISRSRRAASTFACFQSLVGDARRNKRDKMAARMVRARAQLRAPARIMSRWLSPRSGAMIQNGRRSVGPGPR